MSIHTKTGIAYAPMHVLYEAVYGTSTPVRRVVFRENVTLQHNLVQCTTCTAVSSPVVLLCECYDAGTHNETCGL